VLNSSRAYKASHSDVCSIALYMSWNQAFIRLPAFIGDLPYIWALDSSQLYYPFMLMWSCWSHLVLNHVFIIKYSTAVQGVMQNDAYLEKQQRVLYWRHSNCISCRNKNYSSLVRLLQTCIISNRLIEPACFTICLFRMARLVRATGI